MGSSIRFGTLFLLAWRNLWRNYRRTGIMLAAIIVGVWAMIFMSALMRGMVSDMLARGLDTLPGHIQIHQKDFLDDPSVANSMSEPKAKLLKRLSGDDIKTWFMRIKVPALITSERESRGVQLIGIDPIEKVHTFSSLTILSGRSIDDANESGLLIGEKLATRLDTKLGRRVVIMSQDPKNDLAEKGYRIIGIYRAALREQEESVVYSGIWNVQKLLKLDKQVSEVAVFLKDETRIEKVNVDLNKYASDNIRIQTWKEVAGYLSSMVAMMDGFVFVWIVVIFLAMSFGLANTLVMAVFERVRELGLMMALGMRPLAVLLQIELESLMLLCIGLVAGNALALVSLYFISDGIDLSAVAKGMELMGAGTLLKPSLSIHDLIAANVIVLALGMMTAFVPAWRASRYDPVKALTTVN